MEYLQEIEKFFERNPRFNVVLLKCWESLPQEQLSGVMDCEVVDLSNLAAVEPSLIKEIGGYTDLINLITHLVRKTEKERMLIYLDFALTALDQEKRRYFFENVLQRSFPKPLILITHLFSDEVPDTKSQEFNYGKTIEWRAQR